jgi:alkanesulfonate monooxygenase SsuD/methylene tetrahydromethanopterin reductase-like flavin-dependent oxidoreductase (luciferase family)
MQIGLFDHVEHGDRPLARLFDERLKFVEAAEAAGIYCLHVAEHHATPLNMVPVPGVYLGAVARTAKRMRLGPLVYLLPLYSPLRLIEEICMLDHLSHGRLDVGVGRGVSPYELKYHKVEHDRSRDIFIDAFKCLRSGLMTDSLSYESEHYTYKNVPIELRPLQQPHPPFWYGSSNEIGSTWAGEQGLHFVTLGPMPTAKANISAYKAALIKRGGPVQPKAEFPGGAAIGVQRHIFVADTDAEAHRFAKPAMDIHLAHLNWLRVKHGETGLTSRLNVPRGANFEACVEDRTVIVGSPATVRAEIEGQVRELGANYLLTYLFLGTMSLADALRSLELFRSEVMPHLAKL